MQKVLIVEDSPTVLKILRHLSSRLKHLEPIFASSLEQAKQLYAEQPTRFFAALADFNLPDAPNGELIDFLLEQKLPTVVLSGSFNEQTQSLLIIKGVVDYVLKEGRYSYELAFDTLNQLYINQNTKVLVAEDSDLARKHICSLLQRHLFKVIEAIDGVEAFELLQQDPDIKLLISDYQMPNMDGYQLVQKVRHEMGQRRISILGLSSADNATVSSKFIKNGANDYLHKPFSIEEFQCRVNHSLHTLALVEKLEKAAYQDYLTAIPNRRYFVEHGRKQHQSAQDKNSQFAVAVLDIDHFKKFNDKYGHEAGDAVLIHFSSLLKAGLSNFLFARTGGEEFSVACAGLSNEQAYQLLDAFRAQVAATEFSYNDTPLSISVSIGVTNQLQEHLESQLNHADELLYNAKSAGRNIVVGD
ncbi:diguanylate cyclase [Agarivorans sp. 1_MG-2023]|uniref:diguanylate cyclase n=1 Tax=Agarivorans sp. 1_MG-2023 TaxID=3062634 RepID=UPI0026E16521|nr:diguanylate cyclase [Agarivorans sp. 1_MG-2023]MDO6762512.1 diguanylate cyclase [Agarivorans sp. 1_MG-2023]